MEPQNIFYIVAGILYFLYSMKKASDERKQKEQKGTESQKPVTPPSTFGDILREIRKQQQLKDAKNQIPEMLPKPVEQKKAKPKPISVMEEMKRAAMSEEHGSTEEAARVERAKKERAIYHIKTEEEQEMADYQSSYQFNAREAFIGSIIFERKYQ